jgi:hypothetical protein
LVASYEGGYGVDTTRSRFVEWVRGHVDWRLTDVLAANLGGDYAVSPTYISRQVQGGLSLSFGQAEVGTMAAPLRPAQGMLPQGMPDATPPAPHPTPHRPAGDRWDNDEEVGRPEPTDAALPPTP